MFAFDLLRVQHGRDDLSSIIIVEQPRLEVDLPEPRLLEDPGAWSQYAADAEAAVAAGVVRVYGEAAVVAPGYVGADIVVTRDPGDPVIAIEVKVLRILRGSIGGRVSQLLGSAVRQRREFPGGVHLAMIGVLVDGGDLMSIGSTGSHQLARELSRLVRRTSDDAGYDRLIVGVPGAPARWCEVDGDAGVQMLSGLADAVSRLALPRTMDGGVASEPDMSGSRAESPRPELLLVADEWKSRRGGITTFNRELASALAAAGCSVHVVVPDADDEERDQALELGVTLVTPDPIPGVVGTELLLTRPRFADSDYQPDAIVGHGRILGPYAYAAQNLFFPGARRLHIVHMDAERLELIKEQPGQRSAVLTARDRHEIEIELAVSADLVAGVGPLLSESIREAMRGLRRVAPPVVDLRPGLRDWGATVNPDDPPARRQVLLIARAEDVVSKGIDIAARAVVRAIGRFETDAGDTPVLVVRGIPVERAEEVRGRLDGIAAPHMKVIARPYSPDEDALRLDLWQARVVVMPSRHEGFGLVAYEAIAAGVPVLVSRESGVGRLLKEIVVDAERPYPQEVLPVMGREEDIVEIWGDAIYAKLVDPATAFARAADVRRQLAATTKWRDAVGLVIEGLGLELPDP